MNSLCTLQGVTKKSSTTTATVVVAVSPLYTALLALKPPWAKYSAASFSGTTLTDLTGNGRNATMSGVTSATASGNGAAASIAYLSGTASSTIVFPTGSIPTNFTICSITRYTTSSQARLLQGQNINWVHGHNAANKGCYYGSSVFVTGALASTTWVNCCGKNSSTASTNILFDGASLGLNSGGIGGDTLVINSSSITYGSPFALAYLLIWNSVLTDAQMLTVSTALTSYLATGVI
jgi:hypothetical protein